MFAGRQNILWVDDQIDDLMPYASVLEAAGFEVTTASSSQQALKLAEVQVFQVFLVDLRMPEDDGVALLRALHALPRQGNAVFGAFSSFLYLQRYRDRLSALGFPVVTVDKDFPPTDSPDLEERFIAPIRRLVDIDSARGNLHQGETQDNPRRDPFGIPFSEFLQLALPDKEALLDEAAALAGPVIQRAFEEDKVWVLLCGSPTSIRASATAPNQILAEEEIMTFARQLDCAPFQFFRNPTVEDMWAPCQGSDYPTVTLEITRDTPPVDSAMLTVHFDTGAPMTFFSYEDLLELGLIRSSSLFGGAFGRKGYLATYRALPLKMRAILEDQRSSATTSVDLSGQIVRSWLESPYARKCDDKCPDWTERKKSGEYVQQCLFRKGLVGRNLLTDNGLVLILDGRQKATGFKKD